MDSNLCGSCQLPTTHDPKNNIGKSNLYPRQFDENGLCMTRENGVPLFGVTYYLPNGTTYVLYEEFDGTCTLYRGDEKTGLVEVKTFEKSFWEISYTEIVREVLLNDKSLSCQNFFAILALYNEESSSIQHFICDAASLQRLVSYQHMGGQLPDSPPPVYLRGTAIGCVISLDKLKENYPDFVGSDITIKENDLPAKLADFIREHKGPVACVMGPNDRGIPADTVCFFQYNSAGKIHVLGRLKMENSKKLIQQIQQQIQDDFASRNVQSAGMSPR